MVAKGHDFVGRHQDLFNFPRVDDIISQYFRKVQPLYAEYVVRDHGVLIREGPEA